MLNAKERAKDKPKFKGATVKWWPESGPRQRSITSTQTNKNTHTIDTNSPISPSAPHAHRRRKQCDDDTRLRSNM